VLVDIDEKRFERLEQQVRSMKELLLSLNTLLVEHVLDEGDVGELTKGAWRRAKPSPGLTWNAEMTGGEFVDHLVALRGSALGRVLEIGPGYGRVLRTLLDRRLGIDSYTGVDISEQNVEFLRGEFTDPRVSFVHSDVFEFVPDEPFDTIVSSAVFMHIYPNVGTILRKCRELLRADGSVCFDVPLGGARYVHPVRQLFVQEYQRPEVEQHVRDAGYTRCRVVDEQDFSPGQPGLFVCAEA